MVLIEQTINAQIIRDLLREEDVFVEFDFAGVLRGDRLKEVEALRAAIASALMTPNEGRSVLNQPKSDDPAMNEFYLPTNNLAPVGTPPRTPATITTSGDEPAQSKKLLVQTREGVVERTV
jgi:hypothetical protein